MADRATVKRNSPSVPVLLACLGVTVAVLGVLELLFMGTRATFIPVPSVVDGVTDLLPVIGLLGVAGLVLGCVGAWLAHVGNALAPVVLILAAVLLIGPSPLPLIGAVFMVAAAAAVRSHSRSLSAERPPDRSAA